MDRKYKLIDHREETEDEFNLHDTLDVTDFTDDEIVSIVELDPGESLNLYEEGESSDSSLKGPYITITRRE